MRIITQNCFGANVLNASKRLEIIARQISQIKPDLVFLQEIGFPYQAKIFSLPGFIQFFTPAHIFIKGGLLTLVKDNLQVKSITFTQFSSQGKLFSEQLVDRMIGKGFLDIELKNGIHLINTHLVATYSGRFVYDSNQLDQINQLISYFQKLEKVIIAGDFNTDRGGQYYQLMIRYLTDFAPKIECTSPNGKRNIDFVLGKGIDQKVLSAQLINYPSKNYPSDHKGILVEI